jgi:hypothetical protein
MATRSLIAKQTNDGYKAVYCHWDGYPSHNGAVLVENYNTPIMADSLLALGDLSSLDVTLQTTKAYHRDMGRDYEAADFVKTFSELKQFGSECWADYIYIYNNELEWDCYNSQGILLNILTDNLLTV